MRVIRGAAAAIAIAMSATAIGSAGTAASQTVAWMTTIGGSVYAPESYGGGALTKLGTGQYRVNFQGIGGSSVIDVQVTAVNAFGEEAPHYCTVDSWGTDGTNSNVSTYCFDLTGAPADGDFALLYQARASPPSTGAIAFLLADQKSTPSYTPDAQNSYNSTGGTNTIKRQNVGLYFVHLPGLIEDGGNPQVTADSYQAARCEIVDWSHDHSAATVVVQCVNSAGEPADQFFTLSYASGVSHGDSPGATPGGYAWANNSVASNYKPILAYQYDDMSARPIKAGNNDSGYSFLKFPIYGKNLPQPYLGLVTAIGSSGEFCDQTYLESEEKNFTLIVQCLNAQGQPSNDQFSGAVAAAGSGG